MHYTAALFAVLMASSSCTLLKSEGVLVRGSVWLVPQKDVRSAIAMARSGMGYPTETIDLVVVSSRSELYIYFAKDLVVIDGGYHSQCAVVRKEDGRWRFVGMASS